MCDSALALVDEGYTALRVTPSLFNAQPWEPRKSVRATIRTFEKLRRAVGEDIDLMIDVHHRFTPMENVQSRTASSRTTRFSSRIRFRPTICSRTS